MRIRYGMGLAAAITLGGCLQAISYTEATLDPSCCAGGGGAGGSSGTTGTTASSVGGAGGAASCGDGKTQPPEECDNGAENGPQKACKADCTLNVCGDGDVGPGEKCDEGAQNGLGLLKCAPDCSRTIVKKQIVVTQEQPGSNFEPNPVAHADSLCPQNYKALFVFGDARRATTSANEVKNPIDWVIAPYTYYYNAQSNPVWLTDAVALLGVRDGTFIGLENPVRENITSNSLTGLAADWTTLGGNNCNGWSKIGGGVDKSVGWTFATDISFIFNGELTDCVNDAAFYCVEQ
jgi:hypothetical protein